MKLIPALIVLAMVVGCSKEPIPVQSIHEVPHGMPVSTKTVKKAPVAPIEVVKFSPIFFKLGSAHIPSSQLAKLDNHAKVLKNNPNIRVRIIGNASNEGSAPLNMQLGQLRADTIKNYLISSGISANRMTTDSLGKSQAIYTGDKELLNRRVDIIVMP
jgi:outer membrane protein OmpA-like peptidoglycan-associated protein